MTKGETTVSEAEWEIMERLGSSSVSQEQLIHRQQKEMPHRFDGQHNEECPTKSSSTTLGPDSDTSQAASSPQKKQRRISWADLEHRSDENQDKRMTTNQNGKQNSALNGAANKEKKPKNDRSDNRVKRQHEVNARKLRENGSARGQALTSVARRRNGSLNEVDAISLEEFGGPSTPKSCIPSSSLETQERDLNMVWKSKFDYVAVYMTYVLGIGNIISFPQLCYRHGGGAFFVPYFVMLIFEGIPLVCLEMAVGQRFGKNSFLNAWKDLSPNVRGVGVAAVIETLLCVVYYNFHVSWGFYYFIHSLGNTLPWKECPRMEDTAGTNGTSLNMDSECLKSGPSKHYWYRQTLDIADDINHSTGINMYMYLFIFISWVVTFLFVMKGIRKSPKALKICLLFILLILATFFFVGVHLDGWAEGLALLFIPKWDKLLDPVVWMDAASQIFYSLGIGFGSLTLFATGNEPANSFYEDALVCALGNGMTSIWASIIIFSFFGFTVNYKMEHCENGTMSSGINHSANISGVFSTEPMCNRSDILEQIPKGFALAFAGLSDAFEKMPLSTLWSSLFFLLLFLLGASSMLGMMDILVRTSREIGAFPRAWRNELVSGVICLVICAINLIFAQSTGFYLAGIISGASSLPLLFTGLAECIAVSYVYGMERFCKDINLMLGKQPKMRWKLCWKFISPLIILGVIVGGITQMIREGPFTYAAWNRDKAQIIARPYPPWAYVLYVLFAGVPILTIIYPPVVAYFFKDGQRQEGDEEQPVRCYSCISMREACKNCTTIRSKSYSVSKEGDDRLPSEGAQVNDAMSIHSVSTT